MKKFLIFLMGAGCVVLVLIVLQNYKFSVIVENIGEKRDTVEPKQVTRKTLVTPESSSIPPALVHPPQPAQPAPIQTPLVHPRKKGEVMEWRFNLFVNGMAWPPVVWQRGHFVRICGPHGCYDKWIHGPHY